MVAIRNGLLSPELVPFGLHPAPCSHLKGAWYKACLGADRRWVNWLGVLGVNWPVPHWAKSAAPGLFRVPTPAAPSMMAQPDHGGRAVLAVWSLAAWRLDTSPFGVAWKQTADKAARPSHQLWSLIKEDWYTLLSLAAILIAGRKREPEERCFIKRAGESIISP